MLIMIAAVDKNFGLGYKNKLLFHIPKDMRQFREYTMGNIVIMGRKTFESIGGPLHDRTNIVITSNKVLYNRTDFYACDIDHIDNEIYKGRLGRKDFNDVYIIGGGSIYNHYIDEVDMIYLTRYSKEYENVDTYFPKPEEHGFRFDNYINQGFHGGYSWATERWVKK